jgi:hypothetical protein
MNLLNRDFRQMKIAGQHTPFWGGQHGRFLQNNYSGIRWFYHGFLSNYHRIPDVPCELLRNSLVLFWICGNNTIIQARIII